MNQTRSPNRGSPGAMLQVYLNNRNNQTKNE